MNWTALALWKDVCTMCVCVVKNSGLLDHTRGLLAKTQKNPFLWHDVHSKKKEWKWSFSVNYLYIIYVDHICALIMGFLPAQNNLYSFPDTQDLSHSSQVTWHVSQTRSTQKIKDQNHGIPPACFISSCVNPNKRNVMHRPHNIKRFTVTATTQSLYWSCVVALHICLSRPTNKQVSCPVTIGCPMSCKHGPAKDKTRNGVPQFLPRYSVALTRTHTHAHTGCFCSVKTTSEASVAVTAIQGQHVTSLIKQKVTQSRFSIAAFFWEH